MDFKKNWGIWLGLVIVIAFVALALMSGGRGPISGTPITAPAVTSADHIAGNPAAKNILITYEDFQCPSCAAYQPLLDQLKKELPDTLAVVFRPFPLRTIHANADSAAQAAEAADKQGKFWEMHDLLFAKQTDWEKATDAKSIFTGYAVQLGINKDQFTVDMNSDAVKAKIDADYVAATSLGLSGTPTFFVNGKQLLQNPQSYEAFKALVQ